MLHWVHFLYLDVLKCLTGCSFRNLKHLVFSKAELNHLVLSKAELNHLVFSKAELNHLVFSKQN